MAAGQVANPNELGAAGRLAAQLLNLAYVIEAELEADVAERELAGALRDRLEWFAGGALAIAAELE